MTGVRKLQDKGWDIFLQGSCNIHWTESEDLLQARPSCSVCTSGGIDRLLETGWPQPNLARTHLLSNPECWPVQYFLKSTLRYNLLTIKCTHLKCTFSRSSMSSDKCTLFCSHHAKSRKKHAHHPSCPFSVNLHTPLPQPTTDLISITIN